MINFLSNNLKFPPLKHNLKKMPEKLVYYSNSSRYYHDFNMCSTKAPFKTCRMYCNFSDLYFENKPVTSVLIHLIVSSPRKHGSGTEMLNIAKRFSKEKGCEGRFHLFADTTFSPDEVPHVFYRKYGMTTGDKKIDAKIDKFIKKGKKMTDKDIKSMLMYYPPLSSAKNENKSLLGKVKNFVNSVKKIFKGF